MLTQLLYLNFIIYENVFKIISDNGQNMVCAFKPNSQDIENSNCLSQDTIEDIQIDVSKIKFLTGNLDDELFDSQIKHDITYLLNLPNRLQLCIKDFVKEVEKNNVVIK